MIEKGLDYAKQTFDFTKEQAIDLPNKPSKMDKGIAQYMD